MPRFTYNRQYRPPAPTLPVQVSHLFDAAKSERLEGKLDTGADFTVIPVALVTQFNLMPIGSMQVGSYDGTVRTVRVYYVRIHILDNSFVVKVIASNRQNVLLGRDLLNQFDLHLYGKAEVFKIKFAQGGFWGFLRGFRR
jgi:predicted aspartyl protease